MQANGVEIVHTTGVNDLLKNSKVFSESSAIIVGASNFICELKEALITEQSTNLNKDKFCVYGEALAYEKIKKINQSIDYFLEELNAFNEKLKSLLQEERINQLSDLKYKVNNHLLELKRKNYLPYFEDDSVARKIYINAYNTKLDASIKFYTNKIEEIEQSIRTDGKA